MNSGAQAQSHISGVKHRTKMERAMRGFRGRGRGFGPRGSWGPGMRGGFHNGGPPMWAPPAQPEMAQDPVCDDEEANEEYERVLSEALADNIDVEEAKSRAEAAKQAALGAIDAAAITEQTEANVEEEESDDDEEDDSKFPPPGIDIINMPEGENPGTYRCNCCGVMLLSESNLQNHLATAAHQMFIDERRKARRQQKAARLAMARGRGGAGAKSKVYRGRCNAYQEGSMKAQRGRRGLISYGETMPDKLSKSQKKAQPKDIAELLARKAAEGGGDDTNMKKHGHLLMSFVKGETLEGNT